MTKLKATTNGWRYRKGGVLELIQKEDNGLSYYRREDTGVVVCARDTNLERYISKQKG